MLGGLTSLETVTVGNPGNAGEWSGELHGGTGPDHICWAVDYVYNIGKFEVAGGVSLDRVRHMMTPYALIIWQ